MQHGEGDCVGQRQGVGDLGGGKRAAAARWAVSVPRLIAPIRSGNTKTAFTPS
ncbi:hypothetical protein ACFQ9X_31880 [Catenulispora yoronensis]